MPHQYPVLIPTLSLPCINPAGVSLPFSQHPLKSTTFLLSIIKILNNLIILKRVRFCFLKIALLFSDFQLQHYYIIMSSTGELQVVGESGSVFHFFINFFNNIIIGLVSTICTKGVFLSVQNIVFGFVSFYQTRNLFYFLKTEINPKLPTTADEV